MRKFLSELRSAVLITVVLAVVCCGVYPLAVWAIGQACFPKRANGSLITDAHGRVLGSCLLGQPFTGEKYFHSRPSAAGNGYDASSSGGSNLGPTSKKLAYSVANGVAVYRSDNSLATDVPVPADAVTASGSGLDPEISVANAQLQAPRVARARGLQLQAVQDLIIRYTVSPQWGVFGDPGVNVLELNLALDAKASAGQAASGEP